MARIVEPHAWLLGSEKKLRISEQPEPECVKAEDLPKHNRGRDMPRTGSAVKIYQGCFSSPNVRYWLQDIG